MDDTKETELETRLDALAEALRKSEERCAAGLLAQEMLHEVRGPLEALGHLTYLAAQDASNEQNVQRYMVLAEEQLLHLRSLVSDTLTVARQSDSPKPIDLVLLSHAVLRIHQRAIAEKKIHISKKLPEVLITSLHRNEMLLALSNLVVNAIEALPSEGTLYVRARRSMDKVSITVADTGQGIASEFLDAIFDPFFTTKGERGNGLGLTITKKVVDHHKGSIRVRSSTRPTRSGTTFRISLPIAHEEK